MDKNTGFYIVLGFLLLCILLSLDKKEGFVVIREDLFETECADAEGRESCNVFLSGQEGVECVDPDDKNLYNIPQEGRSKFTGLGFNMDPTSCSAGAYANDESMGSQECDSEGQPYTLTGCSAYCTGPSSHPEYTINSPPDSIEPGSVQEVQGVSITCADGYTPAINTCFNKQNGEVSGETTRQACNGEDLEWFGVGDGIKIYCDNPGETYNIMGCEASCYPRTGDHVGDYLINVADISEADYSGNKERIETMENRSSAGLGDKVIHDSFPYSESTDSVFAPNDTFNVLLNPESGWSFRDGGGDITERCNIMGSDDIKNKYFVNGLYPDCDSTREECLNFNIVYSSGAPVNLEGLREELPVENIFPEDQIPDQDTDEGLADLNKYKNALYYFRRFKNSDGNDEIEAQIRCDIDPTSDFHCSFISGSPWYWRPLPYLNRHSPTDSTIPGYDTEGTGFITCENVCQEAGLQCTRGEIPVQDIPAGDTYESKMRNIINRLNLVGGEDLPMNKPDADPAGLNFNNYDDLCKSHAESNPDGAAPSDSAFIEDADRPYLYDQFNPIISNRRDTCVATDPAATPELDCAANFIEGDAASCVDGCTYSPAPTEPENQKLPFGIINGPNTGLGVGHSCLVTQQIGSDGTFVGGTGSSETFTQSCGGDNLVATGEGDRRRIDRTQSGWISDVMRAGRQISRGNYAQVQKWSPICHCSPE